MRNANPDDPAIADMHCARKGTGPKIPKRKPIGARKLRFMFQNSRAPGTNWGG